MKIFLLATGDYSQYEIVGAFSSMKKADEWLEKHENTSLGRHQYYIESMKLNPETPCGGKTNWEKDEEDEKQFLLNKKHNKTDVSCKEDEDKKLFDHLEETKALIDRIILHESGLAYVAKTSGQGGVGTLYDDKLEELRQALNRRVGPCELCGGDKFDVSSPDLKYKGFATIQKNEFEIHAEKEVTISFIVMNCPECGRKLEKS